MGPKSHAKISVSIIKLNVAAKTIRLLGEKRNIEYLHDLGAGKDFLDTT